MSHHYLKINLHLQDQYGLVIAAIGDFHLGKAHYTILGKPIKLKTLLNQLFGFFAPWVDVLVILGDYVDLTEGRTAQAMHSFN